VTVLDHFIAQTLLDARPVVPNTPLPDAQMIQSYRATELHSYTATQASALDATDGVTPTDIACPTPL